MDSFEINKILGAVLATLLIVVALSIVSDMVFTVPEPEQPGYEVAVAEDGGADEAEEEAPEVPLANRLAEAEADAGEAAVRPCATCHTFDQGGENRVGPNLYDVVGGPKAHAEDFDYSDPMQEAGDAGQSWDYEELDAFLTDPRDYMPGTTMAFAGVGDAETRADVIVFLRERAEDPPALPEPQEEVAEAADEEDEAAEAPEEDAADSEDAGNGNGLVERIAAADPADGESAARPCETCHTFEDGAENRVGPNLFGVVGGPKAHADDFDYSDPMLEAADAGETWDHEELDAFLADPQGYMPGTTMAFAGVDDAEARASIIAFLRDMSDDPPPLDGAE